MDNLTPKEIVRQLDRYIIGQHKAKRAVAIALRNRYRRSCLDENLRDEITPKNIIMAGPTGVGKTEIARRLAKIVNAPFIKVEATKFTEVGYVGRDVESMVRDLVEAAIRMIKNEKMAGLKEKAALAAEERILDILVPPKRKRKTATSLFQTDDENDDESDTPSDGDSLANTREKFRQRLRDGKLEDLMIEIKADESVASGIGFIPAFGNDDMMIQIQDAFGGLFPKKKKIKKVTVKDARKIFENEEAGKLVDMDEVIGQALEAVEQRGIIFLDEIDKVAGRESGHGPDVSREGVQRDILPIVEGTTVMTKYGPVKTDYILFIAAGAFHVSKVADLIPELQGRFPIRVELSSLSEADFVQILTQPENAIIKQQTALLEVEGVKLTFTEAAIKEIAKVAFIMNQSKENIGARRLHTVIEELLEELSFSAEELTGQEVVIDIEFVRERLDSFVNNNDLSKFIL